MRGKPHVDAKLESRAGEFFQLKLKQDEDCRFGQNLRVRTRE